MIGRLRTDERGSTLLIVASSLLVLMGFAALAVDWGLGTNQRRADQNASDFGALGAVQFANLDVTATCNQSNVRMRAACNGAEAAMTVVDLNLTFTPDWTQAPCDPNRPAEFTIVSPLTDCISFTSSLDRARVRTPIIPVNTQFGAVFGVTEIDTAAEAEAGARSLLGGAVLPFGIPSNLAGSSYECLRSGAHPQWGPCAGGTTGNYGSLDVPTYGSEEFVQANGGYVPTITRCNGDTNGRLTWNIAAGVDHPMSTYTVGDPIVNDRASCPVFNAEPNQVAAQTGIGSALEPGLFQSTSAYSEDGTVIPGRLSRGGNQVQIKNGVWADDTPLWDFLLPGTCAGVPGVTGQVDNHAEMELCLDAWMAGTVVGIIFDPDIGTSVRYGFAPELDRPFGPGTQDYFIERFRPVYLDTSWFKCTASGQCDTVHSPGELDPSISNPTDSCAAIADPVLTCGLLVASQDIAALSAYMLQPDMLPASIRQPIPADDDQLAYNLSG